MRVQKEVRLVMLGKKLRRLLAWLIQRPVQHAFYVVAMTSFLGLVSLWLAEVQQPSQSQIQLLQPVAQPGSPFFATPVAIREFPDGVEWINTDSKLQLSDLKGKLVLLDFWTYCCINCMHILPVLDAVEKKYEQQLVAIGVHTAKFATEKDSDNIREAILRYEIRHPVFNDAEHILWNRLQIGSWPTLVLLDPQGRAIWAHAGEIEFAALDAVLQQAVAYYEGRKEIDSRDVHFNLEVKVAKDTPLRFPGKVIADGPGKRLFVSDSNHNRIVVCDLGGKLLATIGQGQVGAKDGDFATAQFNHPQGMAIADQTLFVADTENHLIRAVDLQTKQVTTVAGTGKQARGGWFGADSRTKIAKAPTKPPLEADLASPWDLWVHEDQLYVAMAGTHQIWAMDLAGQAIGPFAGNGREDIVDGQFIPRAPFALGAASFAQPSGLASDGKSLFVADSEGSSIRAVPFLPNGKVSTIVGTAKLKQSRLFIFGDTDGPFADVLMQHPLGVAFANQHLYVADTYNNKIRDIDLVKNVVKTLIGDGTAGNSLQPPQLDEPSGLCVLGNQLFIADTNNHRVCVYGLETGTMEELVIEGLKPLTSVKPAAVPRLPARATEHELPVTSLLETQKTLSAAIQYILPDGWKINPQAPQGFVVLWKDADGKTLDGFSRAGQFAEPGTEMTLELDVPPGAGNLLQIGLTYYFCRSDGTGLCLAEASIFSTQVQRGGEAGNLNVEVKIDPDP